MKRMPRVGKLILLLLVLALLACGALLAARKVYSMYSGLSKKMDYANSLIYTIDEDVRNIRQTLSAEFSYGEFDYSWADAHHLVAHGFGGIDGFTYTNSLEAFAHNYALGHRVFEVDFDIVPDTFTMIASHGDSMWREQAGLDESVAYTHDNFMSSRIYGQYTPLDVSGVIDLMVEYPDIYIVTDTKHRDKASVYLQFSQLVKCAQAKDPSVLDRIIPQIYNENMLGWVMSAHPFKSVIYTIYAAGSNPRTTRDFCARSGIRFLTAPAEWINPDTVGAWKELGITIAAHTVNDPQQAMQFAELGVDVLYTDTMIPGDF